MTNVPLSNSNDLDPALSNNQNDGQITPNSTDELEMRIRKEVRQALTGSVSDQSSSLHSDAPQQSVGSIAALAVKLVPLTSQDPRIWFHIIESQFALGKITSEISKYHHLLGALNDRIINDVSDIIIGPRSCTPFSDIKKAILERSCESKQTQIHRLLQGIELGDMKPSQLLRKLQASGGSEINDEVVKTIWMKRLPVRAQEILAPTTDSLSASKLAELADRILETMAQTQVMSINSSSVTNNDFSLAMQISEIIRRLDNMDRTHQRSRSRDTITKHGVIRTNEIFPAVSSPHQRMMIHRDYVFSITDLRRQLEIAKRTAPNGKNLSQKTKFSGANGDLFRQLSKLSS